MGALVDAELVYRGRGRSAGDKNGLMQEQQQLTIRRDLSTELFTIYLMQEQQQLTIRRDLSTEWGI